MKPYRKEKVASLVHEIVSEAIAFQLSDPRVQPLTTVTRVEMTGDLLVANVFLSVPGRGTDERRTLTAIRHAGGYLQRLVAQGLTMRTMPELRFEIDEALKRAKRTMELLDENRRLRPEIFGVPGETSQVETEEETEEDEDDDLLGPDDDDVDDDEDDAQPRLG